MDFIKKILSSLGELCEFSKGVLKIGFFIMIGYYISIIILNLTGSSVWELTAARYAMAACFEAASAVLVAAFAAAAICDLGMKSLQKNKQ